MPFASLGLEPRVLTGVRKLGYEQPTPIQSEAIPHVLDGRDIVGVAQTGTGKTAAFVLPMLQRTTRRQGVRTLIVTPTRELALQINDVLRGATAGTHHHSAVVFGGVGIQPQIARIRSGVDIIVACPGRLLDLVQRRAVDLSKVETLVLDEADRMLDMGFWPDVRRILDLLPEKRQNLLFSATMPNEIQKLVDTVLDEPVHIEVTPPTTPVERIAQSVWPVAREQKTDLLVHMLKRGEHTRMLVFTRTKHRADRLARQLNRAGVASSAIHGDRSQPQRQKALKAFKDGSHPVLVATDVVARGIDIDEVTHVVNYDMPNTAEDYVHRIGRTARAGASGIAWSFLSAEEHEVLREIEINLGNVLACEDADGFRYATRDLPDPERTAEKPKRPQRSGGGTRKRSGSSRGRGGSQGSGAGSTGGSSNGGSQGSNRGASQPGTQGDDAAFRRRAGRRGGKGRASRRYDNGSTGAAAKGSGTDAGASRDRAQRSSAPRSGGSSIGEGTPLTER